jgi:hypothetical protein
LLVLPLRHRVAVQVIHREAPQMLDHFLQGFAGLQDWTQTTKPSHSRTHSDYSSPDPHTLQLTSPLG